MNNVGLPGVVLVFIIMFLIYAAIVIVPFFQLWKRTGHSGWMSLLMLVPIVNLIMIYVLAFKRWPALETNPKVSEAFE